MLDTALQGSLGHVSRAQDIRLERFAGVMLLHRHMLVGRGVEHDVRLEPREGLHHQIPVPDVGKAGVEGRLDPSPPAVHFDPVEVEFAEIHQDQGLGAIPADLADQLRSDRAARPRDQNALLMQKRRYLFLVQLDLFATDEVLHRNFPDGVDGNPSLDQLPDLGDGLAPFSRPLADLDDPPHHVSPRGRDRDEDLVERDRDLPDVADGAENGHPVNRFALLSGVIVEKPDGLILDTGVVENLPEELFPRVSGPDDEKPLLGSFRKTFGPEERK